MAHEDKFILALVETAQLRKLSVRSYVDFGPLVQKSVFVCFISSTWTSSSGDVI